jgi:hypothetical protein
MSWKNNSKHYCPYCKFWIPDTPIQRKQHDATPRHQNALQQHIKQQRKEKDIAQKSDQQTQQELLRINLAASAKYEEDLYGGHTTPATLPKNLPVPSVGGTYNHNPPPQKQPPKPIYQPPMPTNIPLPPPPPPFEMMGGLPLPPPPPPEVIMAMMQQNMHLAQPQLVQPTNTQQHEKPKREKKPSQKKKKKKKNAIDGPQKHMTKEEAYYNDPNFFFYEQEGGEEEEKEEEKDEKEEKVEQVPQEDEEPPSPPRKKYKKEMSEQEHVMIRNTAQKVNVDHYTGFGQWDTVETSVIPTSAVLNPQESDAEAVNDVQGHSDALDEEGERIGVVGSYVRDRSKPNADIKGYVKVETAPVTLLPPPKPMVGFSMTIKKKS